jgi:two-component sensor histidine kinase
LSINAFGQNDTLSISSLNQIIKGIELSKYILIFEDTSDFYTAESILNSNVQFANSDNFHKNYKKSTYWIKTNIKNKTNDDLSLIISFTNLNYVDFYKVNKNKILNARNCGSFVRQSLLNHNDSRLSYALNVQRDSNYSLLIKVNHLKNYFPVFDLSLIDASVYHKKKETSIGIQFFFLGAIFIFFVYCLILYFFNKNRSYLYLSLFIFGAFAFSLILNGAIIENTTNGNHIIAWLSHTIFLYLSIFYFFKLTANFLDFEKKQKKLFKLFRIIYIEIIIRAIIVFTVNVFTLNLGLVTNYTIIVFFLELLFLLIVIFSVYKNLSIPQKTFAFGSIAYIAILLVGFLKHFSANESSNSLSVTIGFVASLLVIIVFLISISQQASIKEKIVNTELSNLNNKIEVHNVILEETVHQRTQNLQQANEDIITHNKTLAERNDNIEVLLKEIHHRVKNNLQLIISLMELQSLSSNNEDFNLMVSESRSRVMTMSLIHQLLYSGGEIGHVAIQTFIENMTRQNSAFNELTVETEIICNNIFFDIDTSIPLGLIINELITNAYKYAYKGISNPKLLITIAKKTDVYYELVVKDNGPGFEIESQENKTSSIGLKIISLLTKQLMGNIKVSNEKGCKVTIEFKDTENRKDVK